MTTDGEDEALGEAMKAFEPSAEAAARIGRIVAARIERESTPLVREWIELVLKRPTAHGGLAFAAALALLVTTPIGSFLLALFRASVS